MDIWATDKSFSVAMGGLDSALYAWDKKTKDLLVQKNPKAKYPHDFVSVQSNYGDFIEAVNEAGEVIWQGGDGGSGYLPIGKDVVRLRFRSLPKPPLSKKELEAARKKVTRYLCSDSSYSLGVPDNLAKVAEWFQQQLKKIPADCRDSATVDFSTRSSYGDSYENIAIKYQQPETDEELTRRLQTEIERARIKAEQERAQFKKLRDKFCAAST